LARFALSSSLGSPEDFAVVFVHCGSVSVVDATYLGFVFNAV
jgi:hypothetical protein